MIGPRFTCISSNHYYDGKDLEAIPFDNKIYLDKVIIEENVWIGANVSVCPGVTIGEGAVIAMGVTVFKDVPPLSIVIGNSMTINKNRNKEKYYKLKEKKSIYNKLFKYQDKIYIKGKKDGKR